MRISYSAFLINSMLARGGNWTKGVNVLAPFVAMLFLALWPLEASANPEGELFKNDTWSGFYIGGHGGYGWSNSNDDLTPPIVVMDGSEFPTVGAPEGWMYGAHIGVQQQIGQWVYGIEGTYDAMDLVKSSSIPPNSGCFDEECVFPFVETASSETKIDNLWTLTARLGYSWDRWLAYVKGGYARAEVSLVTGSHTVEDASPFEDIEFIEQAITHTEAHDGWVIGGGTDYMVSKNVIMGFDYSYINLGSKTHRVSAAAINVNSSGSEEWMETVNIDPSGIHAVSARLTFLFGAHDRPIEPLK